jgi:HlyD family secretion protein
MKSDGPPAQNTPIRIITHRSLRKKEEDKVVVFINEKGTAKMIEVKTGISDYDNIEILSGISDSTEVVTGPFLVVSKRLKDGEKIKKAEKKGRSLKKKTKANS